MSYFKLRLTPKKYDDETFDWTVRRFLPFIVKEAEITKHTVGYEATDSFGKPTIPHIHLHGYCDYDKQTDSLKKQILRFSKTWGYPFAGNKCYSLTIFADPDDKERFFRYPLKKEDFECKYKLKDPYKGFSKEEIDEMRLLAQEHYKIQLEKNLKSLSQYLDKSSFKGKMYDQFSKIDISTHKEFCINLLKHYQSKNKVPPFSKIDDYWVDYQIVTGLLTPEQWYEITFNL